MKRKKSIWERIFGHSEGEQSGDEGSAIGETPAKAVREKELRDERVHPAIAKLRRDMDSK